LAIWRRACHKAAPHEIPARPLTALPTERKSVSPLPAEIAGADWWRREVHDRRRPHLLLRAKLMAALRDWFASQDFIEVECAPLVVSPGNEAHLQAFRTELRDMGGHEHPLYLHTSPEFACKKLLAAGEERIACFAPVFRNGERSALHHPAFTMLEWYRANAPYETLMTDCATLLRLASGIGGRTHARWRDASCDLTAEPERLGVADAFARHAAIDLAATLSADGRAGDRDRLAREAIRLGLRVTEDDSWSDLFSKIVNERVEPHLGIARPTILDRYPLIEAALARPCADDPRFAERFELYVCGVELANAFGELTDATEQRRRFIAEMDEKERVYGERYPLDEALLAALALMPPTSGIALGVDRLAMLVSGATRIEDVIWTPVPDPGNDAR
jgi:lysyl-tRNA synthetase class 2